MTPAPDPRWDDLPPPGFHTTPELPRTTWKPIDLREIVAADHVPLQPTVGQRTDGHGLLYRGRTHTMSGESEAKKSWIAQAIAAQELAGGESVAYLDFEDSAEAVTRRMLTLGATPTPTETPNDPQNDCVGTESRPRPGRGETTASRVPTYREGRRRGHSQSQPERHDCVPGK